MSNEKRLKKNGEDVEESEGEDDGKSRKDWKADNEIYEKNDLTKPLAFESVKKKSSIPHGLGKFLSNIGSLKRQIYKVSVPISLTQPISMLERAAIFVRPTTFLTSIHKYNLNEGERLLRVLQHVLKTLGGVNRKGMKQTKPYSPVKGEIFTCHWTETRRKSGEKNSNKEEEYETSTTWFLAEQVSYHPPISAFHLENKERQILMAGSLAPKQTMSLNSITMRVVGDIILRLGRYNETYRTNLPSFCASGILVYNTRIEIVSELEIRCQENEWKVSLEFKKGKNGYVEGYVTKEEEKIFKLHGYMDKEIHLSLVHHNHYEEEEGGDENQQEMVFLDFEEAQMSEIERSIKPLEKMKENESRRVWNEVTKHIVSGEFQKAEKIRFKIEREAEKQNKKDEQQLQQHVPQYFKNVGRKKLDRDISRVVVNKREEKALENLWEILPEARKLLILGKL